MNSTDAVAMIVLLASSLCMFLLLATLTWLSRRVVRARAMNEKDALRAAGNRLIAALWMVAVLIVATIVFQESHSAAVGLPSLLEPGATASNFGKALVLLPLGAYLLLAQGVVSLTALTWRLPRFAGRRQEPSDRGTALVTACGLVTTLLALFTIALVAFLRLSVQSELLP